MNIIIFFIKHCVQYCAKIAAGHIADILFIVLMTFFIKYPVYTSIIVIATSRQITYLFALFAAIDNTVIFRDANYLFDHLKLYYRVSDANINRIKNKINNYHDELNESGSFLAYFMNLAEFVRSIN